MKIKVINRSSNPLPAYETVDSAGMDVRANLEESVQLKPMERKLIPTGLFMEIPSGYEVQVRPRSGLALKHGITLLNTPGTIDADYRGEIGIIMINLSQDVFEIKHGDRVAQLVINKFEQISWEEVELLETTERGAGGFGHTGKN